jgi:putative tryptophan/tyrosine transport system substrate-binding protein
MSPLLSPPFILSKASVRVPATLGGGHSRGNLVPAVWFSAIFPRAGGQFSCAADPNDQWYRAAAYINHIFRGAKPADLPVQQPVKFEMVVNAKATKAFGLTVPQWILLLADEVIE